MSKKKIAVYGSLRRGEYNFDRFQGNFGEDNFKYQETTEIEGFKLYSLGPYPGIKKSNSDNKLVIDILEVSEEAYRSVRAMELGAGYMEEDITINGEKLPIYVFKYPTEESDLVPHGDWLKRREEYV